MMNYRELHSNTKSNCRASLMWPATHDVCKMSRATSQNTPACAESKSVLLAALRL